tara:strand:+ start:598 stop:906 length:309 start_codon:yes stop_codon:yes gene_type:complete
MEELLMSYIRNANPDATTSELDAKQIVTVKELTNEQRSELIEQYVELVVDNMDIKTMMQFITDLLTDEYHDYSDMELQDQIECTHDEELYTELVDNVTSQGG